METKKKWLGMVFLIGISFFFSHLLSLHSEIPEIKNENCPPKKIERIISASSIFTQILYDLGVEDKIVGVSKSSLNPPGAEKKVQIGRSFGHLNIETILSLQPDIVFCWKGDASILKEKGLCVFFHKGTCDIKKIIELVKEVGKIVGKEKRAEEIAENMEMRVKEIVERIKNIKKKPLVYFEGYSIGSTRGPGSLTHELITLAGGENLAKDTKTPFPLLSQEYIIAKNPDIIIVEEYGAKIEDIKRRPGWQNIKAIKNNKIYKSRIYFTNYTPRCIEGLEQFARWFHPEVFEK